MSLQYNKCDPFELCTNRTGSGTLFSLLPGQQHGSMVSYSLGRAGDLAPDQFLIRQRMKIIQPRHFRFQNKIIHRGRTISFGDMLETSHALWLSVFEIWSNCTYLIFIIIVEYHTNKEKAHKACFSNHGRLGKGAKVCYCNITALNKLCLGF